jgi:hypothetical protein
MPSADMNCPARSPDRPFSNMEGKPEVYDLTLHQNSEQNLLLIASAAEAII